MSRNAAAFAALDAHIAKIRAIPGLALQAAPDVAKALADELAANIARGVGPDGEPWELTKTGDKPLANAAKALNVRASGSVVLATVSGPEAKHHKGQARGHIRRRIIPTRGIPAPMIDAIRTVFGRRFVELMGGRPMTDILALEHLFAAMVAEFAEDGETTNIVFGRKEVTKQINQGPGRANRIVFVPGLYPSGDLGKDLAPSRPGRNPRSIATLGEVFTCFIWAVDNTPAQAAIPAIPAHDDVPEVPAVPAVPAAISNEAKQYKAARLLYDDWRASLYRLTHGDEDEAAPVSARTTIVSQTWITEKNERPWGAEIMVVCTIDAMIPDAHSASTFVPPPIGQSVVGSLVPSLEV